MKFKGIFGLFCLFTVHLTTPYIVKKHEFSSASDDSFKGSSIIVGSNTRLYTANAPYGETEIEVEFNEFTTTNPYIFYKYEEDRERSRLFPEILVITDDGLYQQYGRRGLIDYVAGFVDDVNKYFHEMEYPSMTLSLSGLVMSIHPNAIRFLEPSHIYKNGSDSGLDAEAALKAMKYWLTTKPIIVSDYDFFIILSSWSLYVKEDRRNVQVDSFSTGKVCQRDFLGTNGLIVRTANSFAIMNAVHEIGHLLGAEHDTVMFPCPYFMCLHKNKYVLNYSWSTTSLRTLSESFSHLLLTCLQNKPRIMYHN